MKHIIFLLIAAFFGQSALAQERITVNDPELRFSYELPEGWMTNDDGYYHLAGPKMGAEFERISITYFSQAFPEFQDFFDGFVEIQLPQMRPNASVLGRGKSTVDGIEAFYVSYSFSDSIDAPANRRGIQYLYPRYGQVFYLAYEAAEEIYATHLPEAQAAIKSFRAEAR